MQRFHNLRLMPWSPAFMVVDTVEEAADKINLIHEDYPERVDITAVAVEALVEELHIADQYPVKLHQDLPKAVHQLVFNDQPWSGHWRGIPVLVGNHRPPNAEMLEQLMTELAYYTAIEEQEDILDWYWDFETVHPFVDGNGRVGGIILAAVSKYLWDMYLVPHETYVEGEEDDFNEYM